METDTTQSATTKGNGEYTINNVPEGNRTVTASKEGYVTQSKAATIVADQKTTVNFTLTPK